MVGLGILLLSFDATSNHSASASSDGMLSRCLRLIVSLLTMISPLKTGFNSSFENCQSYQARWTLRTFPDEPACWTVPVPWL